MGKLPQLLVSVIDFTILAIEIVEIVLIPIGLLTGLTELIGIPFTLVVAVLKFAKFVINKISKRQTELK